MAFEEKTRMVPVGERAPAPDAVREMLQTMIQDALQSTSWGIGQLMGFNFELLGYASVQQMVAATVCDEDEQLIAPARFIGEMGVAEALRKRNWAVFAREYNGTGFARNAYDRKLAAAFKRYQLAMPDLTIREAQAALLYLGFNPGRIDGLLGPAPARRWSRFSGSADWR